MANNITNLLTPGQKAELRTHALKVALSTDALAEEYAAKVIDWQYKWSPDTRDVIGIEIEIEQGNERERLEFDL